jgi:hypothetical protein
LHNLFSYACYAYLETVKAALNFYLKYLSFCFCEFQINPLPPKSSQNTSRSVASETNSRVNISERPEPDVLTESSSKGCEYLSGYSPLMVGREDVLPGELVTHPISHDHPN